MEENFLNRESKKEWFLCLLLGFFIGLAVIAPGISGATIAIIFGLYTKLLYSFENLFKKFKKCFIFLIPVGLGIVLGFVFGFLIIQKVFELFPFLIICLFAGLMIGSFPAVKDEIKDVVFDKLKILLITISIFIPIIIGISSVMLNNNSESLLQPNAIVIILYLILGFIISLTQLIPGLSCSALLMAFGQYGIILASANFSYIKHNPLILVVFFSLFIGFAVGIFTFSKIINLLLNKKRDNTYCAIVGLALGSIISMFINPEIFNVYSSWSNAGEAIKDIILGIILMIVGIVLTYLLVKYQRKKNKKQLIK